MQQTVAAASKNIIMMAHTMDVIEEVDMLKASLVKTQG